mmetsp:Transcript_37726/g.104206  ORF Transcript_37726/g.104206 Transcript_37726/m.104206 type:complete len:249 (-) Transcript_37726:147-893(-)
MMPSRMISRMKSRMKRSAERVCSSVFFIRLFIELRWTLAESTLDVISSTIDDWILTSSRMSSAMLFSSLTPSATCSSASSICWSLRCSILRPSCVSISGSSTPPVGTRVALTVIAPCARPPLKSSTRWSEFLPPYRRRSWFSTSSRCLKTSSTCSCRCSACCTATVFPLARAASLRCSSRSLPASSRIPLSCCRILCESCTVALELAAAGRSSSCSRSLSASRTSFTSCAMCALSRLNSSLPVVVLDC